MLIILTQAEEDPVSVATEAVLIALEGSRTVYHTVAGR